MKKFVPLFILIFLSFSANAQVISRFTWESSPVTTAVVGPNAISVSASALSAAGGTNGTKGLNPGNGRNDINMVLDGGVFNVPAIDIAVDFRREETQASFFDRGSFFDFGMNGGNLSVNFRTTNGSSFTAVNSGNIYAIPNDHSFHNYRFSYDNNTGQAKVWVDATVVYNYTGAAGAPLYWTGAGNVTVGKNTDATGNNIPVFDNFIVQQYASALLPLKLLSFNAEAKSKYAVIDWTTTQEKSVAAYLLERSSNGVLFSPMRSVNAANGYNATNRYQFTDSLPFTASYYRLKMIHTDGSSTYSAITLVYFNAAISAAVSVFPNPTADYATIKLSNATAGKYIYTVSAGTGQVISNNTVQLGNGNQQIQIDCTKTNIKGILVIQLRNLQTNATTSFTVIKK